MKAAIAARIASARDKHSPDLLSNATERHYTPEQIADIWSIDVTTVRKAFRDVPGVLKFGRIQSRTGKREYVKLRIPQSVLDKIYSQMAR